MKRPEPLPHAATLLAACLLAAGSAYQATPDCGTPAAQTPPCIGPMHTARRTGRDALGAVSGYAYPVVSRQQFHEVRLLLPGG